MVADRGASSDVVIDGRLEFWLPDPEHRYGRVRLDAGLGTASPRPDLVWQNGIWSVVVDLPPLHRIEYGFEVTHTITDPAGTDEIESGFGARSVIELPSYAPPAWTTAQVEEGTTVEIDTGMSGVQAWLWSAPGLGEQDEAPLVVVHDGPDYAERGELTRYLAVLADSGDAPRSRALLLRAHPREVLYAASEDYASALVQRLLPSVTGLWPTTRTVAVGASLGALAALHVQWRHPGTFDGLLLQSGSFFTPDTDGQEAGFSGWSAVTRFVAVVHADDKTAALPPTAITCGLHEENAANNTLLAMRLREVGVPVTHTEIADLHNFTCWRDTLDPALRHLLNSTALA